MIEIERADLARTREAYAIVQEYYEAVGVTVRDSAESFAREYFTPRAGVWLALDGEEVIGCIALRRLEQFAQSGEVKRLYVKPGRRGQKIAERLLEALEKYAREAAYEALYLDSKDDLKTAIRFYSRHQYVQCERYNDNPQATIFMRKNLTEATRNAEETKASVA